MGQKLEFSAVFDGETSCLAGSSHNG